jgi:hypothetical protein
MGRTLLSPQQFSPAFLSMPTFVSSPHFAQVYHTASSIPSDVWQALAGDPVNSNILYPHLIKSRDKEAHGVVSPGDVWVAVWSYTNSYQSPSLDLLLSCTQGPIGTYPVFIYTTQPREILTEAFLAPRMIVLTDALLHAVDFRRVFSVFAVEPVTRAFVNQWTQAAGVSVAPTNTKAGVTCEYYAALLTYCDRRTFRNKKMSLHPMFHFDLRLATESDIPAIAALCHGFAAESEPFTMTVEQAHTEARLLVENQLIWVHAISLPGQPEDIASICAVTRSCQSVAAITKVYTNPEYRKMGCAERLVRQVCAQYVDCPNFSSKCNAHFGYHTAIYALNRRIRSSCTWRTAILQPRKCTTASALWGLRELQSLMSSLGWRLASILLPCISVTGKPAQAVCVMTFPLQSSRRTTPLLSQQDTRHWISLKSPTPVRCFLLHWLPTPLINSSTPCRLRVQVHCYPHRV